MDMLSKRVGGPEAARTATEIRYRNSIPMTLLNLSCSVVLRNQQKETTYGNICSAVPL